MIHEKTRQDDRSTLDEKKQTRVGKMVFSGQDAWRRHPLFQNLMKNPLPGFQKAVVIYGAFLVLEFGYKTIAGPSKKADDGHHH